MILLIGIFIELHENRYRGFLTDIFKSMRKKSTKVCYFIPILQASADSAFCFFTISTIENIYQKMNSAHS